jgi:hypothetical protein
MRKEIDTIIAGQMQDSSSVSEINNKENERQEKYEAMQNALNMQYKKGPADHPAAGLVNSDDMIGSKRLEVSTEYKTG